MKKIVLTLLSALFVMGVSAQENDGIVYPNTFYGSLNAGASLFAHDGESSFGAPSIGLTGGVWLAEPLAIQLDVNGIMNDGNTFVTAGADFKWDVNSTFFHLYNKNFLYPVPFYVMLGMGGMWVMGDNVSSDEASTKDNSFYMAMGLQAPMRINNYMDIFLQYKCFFLPQGFMSYNGDNFIHNFGIGINLRQGSDPFHRRTVHYTRSRGEDWFFALGIGPNYSAFDIFTNENRGGLSMLGWAPEIMAGRNFSNFWSVRFVLNGLTAHEQYDTVQQAPSKDYRYTFLHADVMLNVSQLMMRGRGVKFNLLPYIGAGPVWRYDHPRFDIAANFGMMFRYYLGRKSDIYMDLRYVMVAPGVGGGTGPSGHFFGVGLPSLTVGYVHNFGHNSTRYRIPLYEVR